LHGFIEFTKLSFSRKQQQENQNKNKWMEESISIPEDGGGGKWTTTTENLLFLQV
jgi:hypothetical protein